MRKVIPNSGQPHDTIVAELEAFRTADANWRDGRVFSLVYFVSPEHEKLLEKAHNLYAPTNALNPMAFKSLRRMEAEVVEMAADLFHAPTTAVGAMTSGGTESIFVALQTYRDRARAEKPWIIRPQIIAPSTVHPAFDKAAHYLGIKLTKVRVGSDLCANVKKMAARIGPQTIALVGSAPQYPHGIIDPIPELSQLAQDRGVHLHVDACVGGFVLPWIERLGRELTTWDFRLDGVTSMSADVHKYGYGAKGASVLIWKDMSFMRHQFFVTTDWPGGAYASPTAAGTRPGGPIASAWAALRALGAEGYLRTTESALQAADELRDGIRTISGLRVLGDSKLTIVAWGADENGPNVFAVADRMEAKGWTVDRQQKPPSVHLTVTVNHRDSVGVYLQDLRVSVEEVRRDPKLEASGTAPMYGMMAKIPVRGLVKSSVRKVMEAMYAPGSYGANVEAAQGNGFVDKLIAEHGGAIQSALDRIDRVRARLGLGGVE